MSLEAGPWIKAAIGYGAFPATLGAALAAAHFGWEAGVRDGFLLVTGPTLVFGAAILLMQRLHPAVRAWSDWGDEALVDVLHTIFSTGAAGDAARALSFGFLYVAAASTNDLVGGTVWPVAWPWWAQFIAAALFTDFLAYWLHRLSHTWEPLWRFHALHHSSERLHTFSSGRNHPLHTALTYVVQTGPLIVMGAPNEILVLFSVYTAIIGLLQHANIAFAHGPLNWIFSTADLHRWHHSAVLSESLTNYGNNLIVWDVVFGTRMLPEQVARPVAVGLGPDARFPRTYLGQLASPWTWRG